MIDFLFIYEVKNRELENICLLKHELSKRGYKVKIVETWRKINYNFPKIMARVVVVFAGYDNNQLAFYGNYAKDVKKIVNLQWEQLYTVLDEENSSLYDIKESATRIVHISWGQNNVDKLKNKCGIGEKYICLAGNMTFDFLKPKLCNYYLTRKELMERFSLPNGPLFLFISSFSFVGMPKQSLNEDVYSNLAYNPFEWQKVNVESQNIILDWFEKALSKYPETTLIYRPHPAEVGNERLENMAKTFPNFRVIRDLSVKQWILCSDKIFTWYSTSIAEIFVAGKTCSVLRPIPIDEKMDIRIYHNCRSIANEVDFIEDYKNTKIPFPLNKKTLSDYYLFGDFYSYLKICDKLVEVLNDDSYNLDKKAVVFNQTLFLKYPLRSIKLFFKRMLIKSYSKNGLLFRVVSRFKNISDEMENGLFAERMIKNNYATQKEINSIVSKLDNILKD